MKQLAKTQVILLLVIASLFVHDVLCRPQPSPRPKPHGSGWVPSGAWSSPAAFGAVNPWPAPAQTGWTDYSVGVDPWATQKARYRANPAAWWASASTSATAAHPTPSAISTTWYQRHHNHPQQPQLPQHPVQYQHGYHHGYQHSTRQLQPQPLTPTVFQYEYQDPAGYYKQYHLEPDQPLILEMPQVVKKKPSYASLYPWAETPSYRPVAPFQPQPHGGQAGWTRIPVLDEEGGNQWVAWVPEEFGDFVIVRKDKIKPKNKKKIEEEEEEDEPEPPKPKKKKVKTIVEEEAPEEVPKPKKKTKTIVEEDAPEEERPRKKVKTIVEDEVPPKKTVTKVVTTEENSPPSSSSTTTSTSSDTNRVTKTEVIEQASTVPEPASVLAPASVKEGNRK